MKSRYILRSLLGRISDRAPLTVSLSVTNRCNLDCDYCNIPSRDLEEMSTEKIKEIIKDIRKLGGVRMGFWGGEPLIREDIGELIRFSKETGLYTTLITNGLLVGKKMTSLKNLDVLFVSLDGTEEIHDKNRGRGSYRKAIEAIEEARKNGIKVVTITTVAEESKRAIDSILEKAEDLDFHTTFELLFEEWLPEGYDDKEEYDPKEIIRYLLRRKEETSRIANSESYLNHILRWDDFSKSAEYPRQKKYLDCYAGKYFCNIDTDGMVYPCELMRDNVEGVDARKLGFEEAWKKLQTDLDCGGCIRSCYSEYNKIFSTDLESVVNAIKVM